MGFLPVPAKMFFSDFSSSVLVYNVYNDSKKIGSFSGLSNSDEHGEYIGFLVEDNPKIEIGFSLTTEDGLENYTVSQIEYDRYNGKAELMKVYY